MQEEQDLHVCARTLRLESTSLVGRMLREYRSTNDSKQSSDVFKKLQLMRFLQYLFTSSLKLRTATIQQYVSRLYLNRKYENNFVTEKL